MRPQRASLGVLVTSGLFAACNAFDAPVPSDGSFPGGDDRPTATFGGSSAGVVPVITGGFAGTGSGGMGGFGGSAGAGMAGAIAIAGSLNAPPDAAAPVPPGPTDASTPDDGGAAVDAGTDASP